MGLRNPLRLFGLFVLLVGVGAILYVLTSALTVKEVARGRDASESVLVKFVHAEGRPELPALSFLDGNDSSLSLADFRGRAVLLNLWATWCSPCIEELPALDRLAASLAGEPFSVVAVSLDANGLADVKPFLEKLRLRNISPYVSPDGSVGNALHLPGIPVSILLDREGREVGRVVGKAEWDSDEARGLVRDALGGG
ncbi:MAG: TlpA family protein disulfide reductase [Alphaproteobacteria bacterium]|nr:TlpA family protein disulfide reductase [Alphaproteobacteria bacterium]